MKNSTRFDSAVSIVRTLAPAVADRLTTKRDSILTGFGTVKTSERDTRTGINYGSASAAKAAKWAGVSAPDAACFVEAWGLSVAIDAAKAAEAKQA